MADPFDEAVAPLRLDHRAAAFEFLDEYMWAETEGEALLPWQALQRKWDALEPRHRKDLKAEAADTFSQVPDGHRKLASILRMPS